MAHKHKYSFLNRKNGLLHWQCKKHVQGVKCNKIVYMRDFEYNMQTIGKPFVPKEYQTLHKRNITHRAG